MSGWSHAECFSIRVSGHDWTEKVLRLARVVGYKLQSHSFDRGVRGQYYASHAEKQLIAYFVDRHVFMSEDKRPDPSFDAEIEKLKARIEEKTFAIAQLGRLQEERQEVELELDNQDNISLGDAYDEKLVQELNMRVTNIDEQCASLRKCSTVMEIRDMESQIRQYKHQKRVHERLNRLWKIAPNERLNQASVFISASKAEICEDCRSFTQRVNDSFRLSIRLHECTT